MNGRNRSALKEWAAIEQVLAAGKSPLLLRKGGLWERREGFEIEHREFWLFPTLYHQNPRELRPELGWALEAARAAHPEGDRVRIEHYVVIDSAFRVESLQLLQALEGLHALTPDTVESRFRYRDRPYLHVLLPRVYRAAAPFVIPNTPDYEGCISWVELDEELSTEGAVPVLDDLEHEALREEALGRIGRAEEVFPV